MRWIHATAFFLAFLVGCAARPKAPEPELPPPKAEPRPVVRTDAALTASPEIAKSFRSAPSICFDGALKLCRDRDYRVVSMQQSASISAHAPAFDLMLAFTRMSDGRTRVTVRRNPENRDEASRFLDQLYDTLLEPRQ